jgi:hypothetical protein
MSDIFIKHGELLNDSDDDSSVLSKDEILESIPKNAFKKQNSGLAKINIEWRWRIFKIPNRENTLIEISFKKPNDKRMYIDKSGKWINSEVDKEFDKFVIDEYYVYSDLSNTAP